MKLLSAATAFLLGLACCQEPRLLETEAVGAPDPAEVEAAARPGKVDEPPPRYHAEVNPLSLAQMERMKGLSWRRGCPVPLEDLVLVRVSHWGYDGQVKEGELVAHREVAGELVGIFEELFESRFPIEKMRLIEEYRGNDMESMRDNNTSAFNCRFKVFRPGEYSLHAHGTAIDINPLFNPYVSRGRILPPQGARYTDRTVEAPGMIMPGRSVHRAFTSRGWSWGGDWRSQKDYQHFEKRPTAAN